MRKVYKPQCKREGCENTVSRSYRKYCSKTCHTLGMTTRVVHTCARQDCDNLTVNDKFCSIACGNIAVPRRERTRARATCTQCGKEYALRTLKATGVCGICTRSFEYFLSTLAKNTRRASAKKLIKFGLKSHKCEVCLRSTWNDQPIPIELDHIDGDSSNNELNNLRILCPNCHAQTPTYCRSKDFLKKNT